jgi:hypothetical protein
MSASRSSAVWWAIDAVPFPRPFTIYAGNVEDVSLGAVDFARALTNSERRETEPETQRTGVEREWNRGRVGGPTAVGSNGETNGDAKVLESLRGRAEGRPQPTGRQISGRNGFGSPSATRKEHALLPRGGDACKCLVLHGFGKIPRRPYPRDGRIALWFVSVLELRATHKLMMEAHSRTSTRGDRGCYMQREYRASQAAPARASGRGSNLNAAMKRWKSDVKRRLLMNWPRAEHHRR